MSLLLLLLLSFFFFTSLLPSPSHSAVDSFIYGGCSQLKYAPGTSYESNINSLLTSFVNSATFTSYNNFTILTGSNPQQDVVYGLYQCRGDLSMPDCAKCIQRSVSQLGNICPDSSGGALMLQGCFVKYDNITFLGVEDKSEVLKKCGPAIGYDGDFMGRRDEVLEGLMMKNGGGAYYRIGGSGKVQGMSQCVQDLSVSECQDCVSEAIGRLRGECGASSSGDMFLGKCYARYSASGFDSNNKPYSIAGSGSSHNDEGEKALAITIGLLAGVALIIIFLSFEEFSKLKVVNKVGFGRSCC